MPEQVLVLPVRAFTVSEGTDMTDEELRETLRQWRLKTATGEKKKAFQVFGNLVLDDLVRRRPKTLENLAKIRGIGAIVLSRYGPDVVSIIRGASATSPPIVEAIPVPTTPKEALIKWWSRAKREGFEVSPRMVDDIVAAMPTTIEELEQVQDMNPIIVKNYGRGILKCLNE
jgi:ribonuclease D